MKMKVKTLACLCALAAVPAFGTVAVESANEFGVLKVSCVAKKVIIATPWVECGSADGSVKITNLVMTAGLSNGDAVLVYDTASNKFKSWVISGGTWSSTPVVTGEGTVETGDAAHEAIARGQAFWFIKSDYTSGNYDLYLYGQVAASATATSTVAGGTSGSPAYSLLASPSVATNDLNSAGFGFTPNASDQIQIPNPGAPATIYTYKNNKWGTSKKTPVGSTGEYMMKWTEGCLIPPGRGFWYMSKGGSGTITW